MKISISFADPDRPTWRHLEVADGTTIEQAIVQSGLLAEYKRIDLAHNKVGIFGRLKPLDTPLAEGDRIEIYLPLVVDPKTVPKRNKKAKNGEEADAD
jgi:putative ubiquitin-RnfH superfamily antitoxin RatB of RatAB toxin-antitoxin module